MPFAPNDINKTHHTIYPTQKHSNLNISLFINDIIKAIIFVNNIIPTF